MLCEEIRQSLSAYIDDALTLPARVAMDEHLDRCPVCRDEMVKLRSVTRSLGALRLPAPPADLITSVSNAVHDRGGCAPPELRDLLSLSAFRAFLSPGYFPTALARWRR